MPSANCFDAPTLKNYLLGKLSDDQSDVVAAHLEACLNCEATVAELDRASDTLTSGLRLPAVAAEPQTDDELQKALNKVQSMESLPNHQTSEVSADRSPVLRDYRLLEPLGFGGMGTVYKAVHTRLDRLVAVKLLPARRLGDEQAVARFQREMRVIGQLSHPAIVQATDAGEVDGTHFLVMEYVEGYDLNTLAKACGPLSVADACEITRQAALGLEYAHQQGIVHRDIKPSNLMLSRNSEFGGRKSERQATGSDSDFRLPNSPFLKILDLGLALLSGEQAPVDELTTVGQLMGTLDYMAPEQLEDSHLVGPRADIYALAATLFRLLTGFAPFANENRKTPLQKLRALATQAAPPICERRADIPEVLAAIIDRALSRDPAERFESMSEFAATLAPWCAGHDLIQLVAHDFNMPGTGGESLSARCGSPDPAAWLDHRSPSVSRRTAEVEPHSGDLRSVAAAGSGNPRRAPAGHVENVPHSSPPRRALLIALAFLIVAAFGIVITIETNKGTLIVESLRDGVEVRVKKSGKSVEQLELTTGPKTARLTAGEYEIEIVGDADGLQIQNGKFVLKRGDTVVAKITEIPKGQPVVAKPTEPVVAVAPGMMSGVDLSASGVAVPNSAPVTEPDDEKPNPTAKSIDQGLADHPDRQAEAKFREALRSPVDLRFQDQPLTDVMEFLTQFVKVPLWLDEVALNEEAIPLDAPITLELKEVSLSTALLMTLRPLQLTYFWDGTSIAITTMAKAKEQLVTRSYPVGRSLPMVRKAVRLLNERGEEVRKAKVKALTEGTGGGFFDVPTTIPHHRARRESPEPHQTQLFEKLHFQFGGGGGGGGISGPVNDVPQPRTAAGHYEELFGLLTEATWQNINGEGGTLQLLGDVLVIRQTRPAHEQIESVLRILEQAAAGPLPQSTVEIRRPDYPSAADQVLREKLAKLAELEVSDVPLTDALNFLETLMEVRILLDKEKLSEEAIPADATIKVSLKNLPFQVVLHRLLDPLQLTADIEEGLLIVTTKSAVRQRLVPKVYEVRDLLDRGVEAAELIAGLQTGTAGPWVHTDGEGGQALVFADRLLFITQTQQNHDESANFLRDLRSQLSQQPLKKPLAKAKPATTPSARPAADAPKTTTPPPDKPTADNQPHYDGKSFDEWLAILDTERSPARLADAIEALRLLGRDTHAQQIAERVLKASRVVDLGSDGNNRPSVYGEVWKLFNNLPAAIVQRACANELKNGTPRSRKFLINHANLMRIESPVADELLSAMLETCRDNDSALRKVAVANLQWFAGDASNSRFAAQRVASLHAALTDPIAEVAMTAAEQLRDVESEAKFVAEALARIVAKPDSPDQRMNALNQLAVMGPRAASVASQVAAVLLEPLSDDDPHIDQRFDGWLGPFRSERRNTFHYVAAVALARMGPAAAAELPILQKALDNPDAMKGYETRTWADLNNSAQWPDLLRAVKSRLAEPATLDIRGGNMNVVDSAIRLYERSYHLLKMEAALLQLCRPKDPTIKQLLERCELIKHDITLVHHLRSIRQPIERPDEEPSGVVAALVVTMQQQHQGKSLLSDERPTETSTGTRILADSPRQSAIHELSKLGPAARVALPMLKKESESTKKSAAAAEKAIKQIEAAKDGTRID